FEGRDCRRRAARLRGRRSRAPRTCGRFRRRWYVRTRGDSRRRGRTGRPGRGGFLQGSGGLGAFARAGGARAPGRSPAFAGRSTERIIGREGGDALSSACNLSVSGVVTALGAASPRARADDPTPEVPERDPSKQGVPFRRYFTKDRLGRQITFYLSMPRGGE